MRMLAPHNQFRAPDFAIERVVRALRCDFEGLDALGLLGLRVFAIIPTAVGVVWSFAARGGAPAASRAGGDGAGTA